VVRVLATPVCGASAVLPARRYLDMHPHLPNAEQLRVLLLVRDAAVADIVRATFAKLGIRQVVRFDSVLHALAHPASKLAHMCVAEAHLSDLPATYAVRRLRGQANLVISEDSEPLAARSSLIAGVRAYLIAVPSQRRNRIDDDQFRRASRLTRRELQILQLIADGASNASVAGSLGIRPSSVKGHLARVNRKLGTPDRATAVLAAMRQGMVA